MTAPFVLNDQEVIQFAASRSSNDPEPVSWKVGFAPETLPPSEGKARVVVATLRAESEEGWAEVTVGSVVVQDPPAETHDALADQLAESDALQALFMFARSHLVGMLATVGVDADVERSLPDEFEVQPLAPLDPEDYGQDGPAAEI